MQYRFECNKFSRAPGKRIFIYADASAEKLFDVEVLKWSGSCDLKNYIANLKTQIKWKYFSKIENDFECLWKVLILWKKIHGFAKHVIDV